MPARTTVFHWFGSRADPQCRRKPSSLPCITRGVEIYRGGIGGGGQPHAPAPSIPRKDPVPIVQEAGWAPGPVWTGGKSRHRDSIPDVQPVVSRYPDWATGPTFKILYYINIQTDYTPILFKEIGGNCSANLSKQVNTLWKKCNVEMLKTGGA